MMTRTLIGLCIGLGLLAQPLLALDLDLKIQAAQPTSINLVLYRVAGVDATVAGADVNQAVTLSLTGLAPGLQNLATSFGRFTFEVDAGGVLTVAPGQALTTDGSSLTIQNTVTANISLGAAQATTMPESGYRLNASESVPLANGLIGTVQIVPGADAATPVAFQIQGVVPDRYFEVYSSFGRFQFQIDGAGTLVAYLLTGRVPYTVSGQAITVQNTVDMTITCAAERPTSIQVVRYRWNTAYAPFNTFFGVDQTLPGASATTPIEFPVQGLAPNQALFMMSSFDNNIPFVVQADGTLVQTAGSFSSVTGANVIVHNTIDLDGFAIRGAEETTLDAIIYNFANYAALGGSGGIDVQKTTDGVDVTTPLAFDVTGLVPDTYIHLSSTFGTTLFYVDVNGKLVDLDNPGLLDYTVEPGNQVVIQNTRSYRFRVWSDDPVVNDVTLFIVGSDVWRKNIAPTRVIPGADFPTGVEFCAYGLVAPMWFIASGRANDPDGGPSGFGGTFRILNDGTAEFAQRYSHVAALHPLTATKGYSDIHGGPNRMYLEIFPAGSPPAWTTPLGDNRTLLTSEVAGHVLSAVATDADGDALSYRWLRDGVEVAGETTDSLTLGLLAVGDHIFTLEVSDCFFTVSDSVIVTVGNSPPVVTAGGGGTYDTNAQIALTGTVSDFDGDELTYRWMLNDLVLVTGTVSPPAGGAPLDLPAHNVDASSLGAGMHTLQLVVEDLQNGPQSAEIEIDIQIPDTVAPRLRPRVSRRILWPADGRMVEVLICANATDDSGVPPALSVEVIALRRARCWRWGRVEADYEILGIDNATGRIRLNLRASSAGRGPGLIYRIIITATDAAGNAASARRWIVAPPDRRRRH